MQDNLEYIREAIQKHGRKVKVDLVRWEKNPKTGERDLPIKIQVAAWIALQELEKPLSKRGYVWQMVRPVMPDNQIINKPKIDLNSLSDPALRQQIIDEAKAQILAESKATIAAIEGKDEETVQPIKIRKKRVTNADATHSEEDQNVIDTNPSL